MTFDARRPRPAFKAARLAGLAACLVAAPAFAQSDADTIAEMRRQLDEMRRRMEQMERQLSARPAAPVAAAPRPPVVAAAPRPPVVAAAPRPATPGRQAAAPDAATRAEAAAADARAAADQAQAAQRQIATAPVLQSTVPGLAPPTPVGDQTATEDALRSDLPGIAFRVPGTDTQVRLYGFAKLSAWQDFNGRNQTDAPLPGGVPLNNSPADRQGGDFGMTARFSRFGIDTRTLTGWGTLETRLEGDFGGGSPTSSNAVFRLRQAFAEIGDERLRVLIGQANSLWNEGLYETLIDATNLNQSFIRQAQIRVSGRLAQGLTGQVSLEAPDTQYTAAAGAFNPGSTLDGGASPAFNSAPDLLGRLTYRNDGLELGARGMLRQLSIRPEGTNAPAPSGSNDAVGWGLAGHVRFPLRWLAAGFGGDELLGMAYVGQGIGRYQAGSTNGLDATSDIGLQGVGSRVSLDPVPSYGATIGYRRFWTQTVRSNFTYSYAQQEYEDYALQFTPGSASATSLNRDVQQVFANLIWSPFAETRNGVFGSGWLDIGVEYLWTRRNVFGGDAATGSAGQSVGDANRILFATIARF